MEIMYELSIGGISFDPGWPWKVKLKVIDFKMIISPKLRILGG